MAAKPATENNTMVKCKTRFLQLKTTGPGDQLAAAIEEFINADLELYRRVLSVSVTNAVATYEEHIPEAHRTFARQQNGHIVTITYEE